MKFVEVRIKRFCQETSLHGWKYCTGSNGPLVTILWLSILVGSMTSVGYMMILNISNFCNATVAYNLDSPNADLKNVFFPSAVVCNMNTLRRSFIYELHEDEDLKNVDLQKIWKAVHNTFIVGKKTTEAEDKLIQRILASKTYKKLFKELYFEVWNASRIISDTLITRWHDTINFDITDDNRAELEAAFLPEIASQFRDGQMVPMMNFSGYGVYYSVGFSTDVSESCLWLTPFVKEPSNPLSVTSTLPSCRNGVHNGLYLLLDAETFDYSSSSSGGEGFIVSILHHLDIPIMKQSGINIQPGSSTKISVTPRLLSTNEASKRRFSPVDRGCYFDDEINLTHFRWEDDYRYEMSNCLFEATLQEIEAQCQCTPKNFMKISDDYDTCTGEGKECMNQLMLEIGDFRTVQDKGQSKECLAACTDQKHSFLVTSSSYPNEMSFSQNTEYCVIIRKLMRSCQDARRKSLDQKYPDLCSTIQFHAGNDSEAFECPDLTENGFRDTFYTQLTSEEEKLKKLVFEYARKNIVVLSIFIRDPYVAHYVNEEKITEISFVGTIGGLLGIFMGFSFISVVEMIFLCLGLDKEKSKPIAFKVNKIKCEMASKT